MAKKRKAATLDEAYEEWYSLPESVKEADMKRVKKKAVKAKKRRKAKVEAVRVDVPTEEAHSQASEAYWWDVPWTTTGSGSSGSLTIKPTKGAGVDSNGNVVYSGNKAKADNLSEQMQASGEYKDYGYRCTKKKPKELLPEEDARWVSEVKASKEPLTLKALHDAALNATVSPPWGQASCQDPADGFPYPKRETVLEEAERLTAKVKPEAYDHPAVNFSRLGKVWAAILKLDHDIPSEMVALMMACHKLVRESHKHERDNVVDACGYLRCVEKIREKEMRLP